MMGPMAQNPLQPGFHHADPVGQAFGLDLGQQGGLDGEAAGGVASGAAANQQVGQAAKGDVVGQLGLDAFQVFNGQFGHRLLPVRLPGSVQSAQSVHVEAPSGDEK